VLGVDTYKLFDVFVPLVQLDVRYPYDEVLDWITASVGPLGREYQENVRRAFEGGWIDVFENAGKRSGAYSAPVYGSHPYMLLNYNETLDAVFTLAHEMGHSMHTLLAHRAQPFVYAGYTIFVAEVPSTLSEALFLDFMLERARSREERAVLLQHAIDSIASTFFTQVLFADFELQAHRLVEQDQPVTAAALSAIYAGLLREYYGDVIDEEEISRVTWARIPHFFSTPYYVYQYSTCFASTARLMQDLRSSNSATRVGAVSRYVSLLEAGGSDYPVTLLQRAGVDLTRPDTVRAVSVELDQLVTKLEREL
jgi:oligoendopeptidase F